MNNTIRAIGIAMMGVLLILTPSISAESAFPWTFPITLGEGGGATTPSITSLANSTPGVNNVTITWTTNQTTNNKVKYSHNSDLSDYSWSTWDNSTASVSIGLSGLDAGTTYYYQAWSYNATDSSYSTTDPTSSPYESFTTQSSGGTYNTTLPSGWSIIGWTNQTASTAHGMGTSIGGNCQYVTERNSTTGQYVTHVMSNPTEDDFAIERGWGYFVKTTAETVWERAQSSGGAYNITLPQDWSIIGWTNTTASTAHAMGTSIGGNCQYVTERNSTTGQYVTHVMSNPTEDDFAIERGWGYFVKTTAETLWERDS